MEKPNTKIDHRIKSWPQFFQPMIDGLKKHDMRNMKDRDYKVGQVLLLQEFDPFGGGYTGREAMFRVTYITSNDTPCALSSAALEDGFAILSLERLSADTVDASPASDQLAFAFNVQFTGAKSMFDDFLYNARRDTALARRRDEVLH